VNFSEEHAGAYFDLYPKTVKRTNKYDFKRLLCMCVYTAYAEGTITELHFKQLYSEFNLLTQEFVSAGNGLIYIYSYF
jgi:hypothetical protein